MELIPLRDNFLFKFTNEHAQGMFIEKNKFGFILTNQDTEAQGKYARWGQVTAIGEEVTEFSVGDYVLIESGMWTLGFKLGEDKVWKSDQTKVCAIGDESLTYAY